MQLLQTVVRFLVQPHATTKVQLLKVGSFEEKRGRWMLRLLKQLGLKEKMKDHVGFCKVLSTNPCATSLKVDEVLSLASCYKQGATSQISNLQKKRKSMLCLVK